MIGSSTTSSSSSFDIKIDIDNSKTSGTFTNSDIIQGNVILQVYSEINLNYIQVKLEGISKINLLVPKAPSDIHTQHQQIGTSQIKPRQSSPQHQISSQQNNQSSSPIKYKSIEDSHRFLYDSSIVFPTDELQRSTNSKEFTFIPGVYYYPFKFRLPLNTNCNNILDDSTNFHGNSGGFGDNDMIADLNNRPLNIIRKNSGGALFDDLRGKQQHHMVSILPPSLSDLGDKAMIKYFIKVTCKRSNFFKNNIRLIKPFIFLPVDNIKFTKTDDQRMYVRNNFKISNKLPEIVAVYDNSFSNGGIDEEYEILNELKTKKRLLTTRIIQEEDFLLQHERRLVEIDHAKRVKNYENYSVYGEKNLLKSIFLSAEYDDERKRIKENTKQQYGSNKKNSKDSSKASNKDSRIRYQDEELWKIYENYQKKVNQYIEIENLIKQFNYNKNKEFPKIKPVNLNLYFEARFRYPAFIIPSKKLNFKLYVLTKTPSEKFKLFNDESSGLGKIYLQYLKINLIKITKLRSTNDLNNEFTEYETLLKLNNLNYRFDLKDCKKSNLTDDITGKPLYELEIPNELFRSQNLPDYIGPSFKTCNISRNYKLAISAGFSESKIKNFNSINDNNLGDLISSVELITKINVLSGLEPFSEYEFKNVFPGSQLTRGPISEELAIQIARLSNLPIDDQTTNANDRNRSNNNSDSNSNSGSNENLDNPSGLRNSDQVSSIYNGNEGRSRDSPGGDRQMISDATNKNGTGRRSSANHILPSYDQVRWVDNDTRHRRRFLQADQYYRSDIW
ncbi:hypothetical protein B5S28_g2847 [[Candida] boidinii]|nr:hypothetical protein B5S28_g2847 [[Candida] boidinii]